MGPGTYSPTTGCKKLEAIEKGDAAPNIATYPLTLTREGTRSWEGGCDFSSIREVKPNIFEGKVLRITKRRSRSDGSMPTASKLRAAARHSFMSAAKR